MLGWWAAACEAVCFAKMLHPRYCMAWENAARVTLLRDPTPGPGGWSIAGIGPAAVACAKTALSTWCRAAQEFAARATCRFTPPGGARSGGDPGRGRPNARAGARA